MSKITKKIFYTQCDMGSIKIFNESMSAFFDNDFGDMTTKVSILNKEPEKTKDFLGHFTVKTEAYLSGYDCADEPIYTFKKGRYFVFLVKPLEIAIIKWDEDIHA